MATTPAAPGRHYASLCGVQFKVAMSRQWLPPRPRHRAGLAQIGWMLRHPGSDSLRMLGGRQSSAGAHATGIDPINFPPHADRRPELVAPERTRWVASTRRGLQYSGTAQAGFSRHSDTAVTLVCGHE